MLINPQPHEVNVVTTEPVISVPPKKKAGRPAKIK
jgi:hypothetical protein